MFSFLRIHACTEAHGTQCVNRFMKGIYEQDVFIDSGVAGHLSDCLYQFIAAYCYQADAAFQAGEVLFALFPKLHAVHEVAHRMRHQSRRSPYTWNPAATSCSMDEDFIGRYATLSRCVSPKQIAKRTLQRYLCQIQISWARA